MNINIKQCIKCDISKPINQYYKSPDISGGYKNICIECIKQQIKNRIKKRTNTIVLTERKCKICTINKQITEYNKISLRKDGYNIICRECVNEQSKNKRIIAISEPTITKRICNTCNIEKYLSEFRTNKTNTIYYNICLECYEPHKWTKEKQRASERAYIENNNDKMKEKYRKQNTQINRNVRIRLNTRIKSALNKSNLKKNNYTVQYIGCTCEYLIKWFEYQFNDNINLDNKSEWHIDHVLPCSSFDLSKEEEQLKCFNWTNLRPCLSLENIIKSNKIIPNLIKQHNALVNEFIKINPLPTHPGNRVEGTE